MAGQQSKAGITRAQALVERNVRETSLRYPALTIEHWTQFSAALGATIIDLCVENAALQSPPVDEDAVWFDHQHQGVTYRIDYEFDIDEVGPSVTVQHVWHGNLDITTLLEAVPEWADAAAHSCEARTHAGRTKLRRAERDLQRSIDQLAPVEVFSRADHDRINDEAGRALIEQYGVMA